MPLLKGVIHSKVKAVKAPKALSDSNEQAKVVKQWMV
jgi:hypothetical protein